MILLTGPTGSGKSTTLYAALRHRLANYPGRIITVEDPVEYDIVGVAQAEVDSADKLRFDTALRTILRSDPDVIMIGEIRDFDLGRHRHQGGAHRPPGVQLAAHQFGRRASSRGSSTWGSCRFRSRRRCGCASPSAWCDGSARSAGSQRG